MSDSTPTPETVEDAPGSTEPSVADRLAEVFALGPGALAERMGIEITEAAPERVAASMPVEGNTQPYGILHGGASVVLAETVGSISAALHAGPQQAAVGVDVSATHHRAAATGSVHAVATPLHRGRTMASYEIVITDDAGRRVCTSRLTCAILARPRG